MKTLREEAQAYEPPVTMNIADLDEVALDTLQIQEKDGKNSDDESFTFKYFTLDGKDYRVPNSVLEQIQTILKLKPAVTKINVIKSGSGLATRYKVEPLN